MMGMWSSGFSFSVAATNILDDSLPVYYHWAWNPAVGWIDFQGDGAHKNVNVRDDRVDGYAGSAAVGYLQLDCLTPPPGGTADCVTAGDWRVTKDAGGHLAGWAWSETVGWISFSDGNAGAGGSFPYGVSIDVSSGPDRGEFSGWAWNAIVGWISFNCANDHDPDSGGAQGICSSRDYQVKADLPLGGGDSGDLISSTFDFSSGEGVMLNALMWKGLLPTGTVVKLQIASSNTDSSPSGFAGPDGTNATYYQPGGPGIFKEIKNHGNIKYFRYRVFLESDNGRSAAPRVDDVIINYSP